MASFKINEDSREQVGEKTVFMVTFFTANKKNSVECRYELDPNQEESILQKVAEDWEELNYPPAPYPSPDQE